jgi:hypothetical protein
VNTNRSTAERTRRRFVEEDLEAALSERPQPGAAPALDHKGRATLLALICWNPPEGRTCWTMQLLTDELDGLPHRGSPRHGLSTLARRQTLPSKRMLAWDDWPVRARQARRGTARSTSPSSGGR